MGFIVMVYLCVSKFPLVSLGSANGGKMLNNLKKAGEEPHKLQSEKVLQFCESESV